MSRSTIRRTGAVIDGRPKQRMLKLDPEPVVGDQAGNLRRLERDEGLRGLLTGTADLGNRPGMGYCDEEKSASCVERKASDAPFKRPLDAGARWQRLLQWLRPRELAGR